MFGSAAAAAAAKGGAKHGAKHARRALRNEAPKTPRGADRHSCTRRA